MIRSPHHCELLIYYMIPHRVARDYFSRISPGPATISGGVPLPFMNQGTECFFRYCHDAFVLKI